MKPLKILLLILILPALAHAGWVKDCLDILGFSHRQRTVKQSSVPGPWTFISRGVLFNGVELTGNDFYPEAVVLNNLDFIPDQNADWTASHFKIFKNRRILSLGEGTSSIVLMLRKNGFSARALDTWYGRNDYPTGPGTEALHWFLKQYEASPEALVSGDARKIALPDESEDLVFSHQLVNNLTMADRKRVLMESIRLISVDGETRHYEFSAAQLENVIPFLKSTYGNAIEINSVKKKSEILHPRVGRREMHGSVLIVHKKASTGAPVVEFAKEEEKRDPVPTIVAPPTRPSPSPGVHIRGLN